MRTLYRLSVVLLYGILILALGGCANRGETLTSSETVVVLNTTSIFSSSETSAFEDSSISTSSNVSTSAKPSYPVQPHNPAVTPSFGEATSNSSNSGGSSVVYNIKLSDFRVRDPYILADASRHKYYLFYAAGDTYCLESEDMLNWGNRRVAFFNNGRFYTNWAPEVHQYQGKYYMFTTLSRDEQDTRACSILVSDTPYGPYSMWAQNLTPAGRSCIDGTLYVENGKPYMVYSDEYVNADNNGNGRMVAIQLSQDLKSVIGEPRKLFRAKDNALQNGVTDGPFLYTAQNGKLVMFWSTYTQDGNYTIVTARSSSGILGHWTHDKSVLFDDDGGHPMLFRDFGGRMRIAFHAPNNWEENVVQGKMAERAEIWYLIDNFGTLSIQPNP